MTSEVSTRNEILLISSHLVFFALFNVFIVRNCFRLEIKGNKAGQAIKDIIKEFHFFRHGNLKYYSLEECDICTFD